MKIYKSSKRDLSKKGKLHLNCTDIAFLFIIQLDIYFEYLKS